MLRRSKLRLIAMLVGAIAAFSVVGFAASFTVNQGDDIVNAEGETLVVSCSPDIKVDKIDKWRDPTAGGPGAGGFYVERVRVVGLANYAPACSGKWFYIVLTGSQGQKLAILGAQWNGSGNVDLNFASSNIAVADLHDIHVLISDSQQNP